MIDLAIADDVATVVLDAPAKLNALDEAALAELDAAYREAEAAGVRRCCSVVKGGRSAPGGTSPPSIRATTMCWATSAGG